ncbi:MAG TPA: cyclase family protein [Methanosarcina sp.]|nr:cyclase family protein [Methanosarcina sp.]
MQKIPTQGKIIDITTPISPSMNVFPGDPQPSIEMICTLEKEGCALSRLSFGSHTGTHVDAPSHILNKGLTVDKLELESLMGRALVLDFTSFSGTLTANILEKSFQNAGFPEDLSILLLKTENLSQKQNNPVYLEKGAASWIVEKGFKAIGIDSFSVDDLHSGSLPVHHILLSRNVNIIECLEFSSVEPGIYFFLCLPLKIEACDGAPARALLISYS